MSSSLREDIKKEKAFRDAGYEGSKNSASSTVKGAVSGAVAGNIASSLSISKSHPITRRNILGGAAIGSAVNFIHNNMLVNKSDRARAWLRNKAKEESEKSKENVAKLQKHAESIVEDSVVPTAMTAGLGALVPIGGSRRKTAMLGAAGGAIESLVSSGLDRLSRKKKGDKKDTTSEKALKAGAALGAAGAVVPAVERGMFFNDKKWAKDVANSKENGGKASKIRSFASVDMDEASPAYKAKNVKGAMHGIWKPMVKRGLIAGGIGAGLSLLASGASKKNKGNANESTNKIR